MQLEIKQIKYGSLYPWKLDDFVFSTEENVQYEICFILNNRRY